MKKRFGSRTQSGMANRKIASQVQLKFQQALTWHQQGQLSLAQVLYEEILTTNPRHLDALHMLGVAAAQTRNLHRAVALFDQTIAIAPNNPALYFNRALALQELQLFDTALADYEKAIALEPNSADIHFNRGITLHHLGQVDAAIASYNRAMALAPDFAEAYNSRGIALHDLRQLDAALASYDRAIAIIPGYAEAYYNRGITLRELNRLAPALASFDRAIAIAPEYAEAYNNRGVTLQQLKEFASALADYDRAISIKPDYAEAYYNRGIALQELKQFAAAITSFDRAIALEPEDAEAHNNRGTALQELKQFNAALASYDKAITLKPDYAEAHYNRGVALQELKQHQAAIASYDKALAINSDYDFLHGMRFHTKMHICDWSGAKAQLAELIEKIQGNDKASPPFPVLSLTTSLPVQRKAAETYVREKCPANFDLGEIPKRPKGAKIRIGYFSMDFRNHPVSFLTAGLFETHDRNSFEVVAFSFGPETPDEMRQRLEGAFDKFIEVRDKSDQAIAEMARRMEIDIAIDLAGFTADSRTGIFSYRAAPIQVNFLGYPGTMGADYMDYLLADQQAIPEEARVHYSEKIAYLPSFQPNDRKRQIADKVFSREELGLPPSGFVFCCFNYNYKITPNTLDGWMRILKRVADSVLWLYEDNPTAANNLRKEAAQRGMDVERLVFAKRLPTPEYLARYRCADLFLDTLPFNAGTTASDALWAGLPVLTCPGEAFASRMATSLLTAIDMPELIAATQEDYENLAVELASNPERLMAIKQKLERNRLTTPLFDTELFTRHLEDAFTQMHERYQAALPPDHIYVESKQKRS